MANLNTKKRDGPLVQTVGVEGRVIAARLVFAASEPQNKHKSQDHPEKHGKQSQKSITLTQTLHVCHICLYIDPVAAPQAKMAVPLVVSGLAAPCHRPVTTVILPIQGIPRLYAGEEAWQWVNLRT